MSRLDGRVAVVTGASKGIGRAIASALAAAGSAVAVNYVQDRDGAEAVAAEIDAAGGLAIAVQADCTVARDVDRIFDIAGERFGPVDLLVNNAGVFSFQPIEQVTGAEYRRLYDTNVLGPILTMQRFISQAPSSGGSIINISSAGTALRGPGSALYTSTKAAVVAFTQIAARELGPRNIRVNVIAPGATATEGAHDVGALEGDRHARLLSATPLGRIGRPEDIAPVAVFLASDDARWITGDTIYAAGGIQ